MAQSQKVSTASQGNSYAEKLAEPLLKLAKAGGFSFLEGTIDGIANLNPDRKSSKTNIFNRYRKEKRKRRSSQNYKYVG